MVTTARKMPVVPMGIEQIESFLATMPPLCMLEMDTVTVPAINQPCPFPNIFKFTTRLVEIGDKLSYKDSVRANQEVEGRTPDFVPNRPNFGTKIRGTPLQEHKGKIYLPCIVLKTLQSYYCNANFNKIPTNLIDPFLRKTPEVKSQPTSAKVVYRKYLIDSILAIRINGVELKAV
jgi:hypothetical protein